MPRAKTSLSDFSLLSVRYNWWQFKDMCKGRLLLNDDAPVFHENLFKIRCSRVISGNKRYNFFRLISFVTKSLCSVGELNFSQDFRNELPGIASVTESLFKVSLTEFVFKSRNASSLIEAFFVLRMGGRMRSVYTENH